MSSVEHPSSTRRLQFSRKLGDSELSYFLPSRDDGVNDMYLHLGFRAPSSIVSPDRLALAWAILRGRHPLLASHVAIQPGKYDDVRFVYTPPASPAAALADARATFERRDASRDALIDAYLNGPRTLSNERVSYLILASSNSDTAPPTPPATPDLASSRPGAQLGDFDLLICAAHFLGDGMALHTFANDLFGLVAGPKDGAEPASDEALYALLQSEWSDRWGHPDPDPADASSALPASLEARLPPALSTFQRVACAVEFKCSQDRLIGGHAFARAAHGPRRTIVPTVSFDADDTRKALRKCKAEGVSIAHAMFALCNIAWARVGGGREQLPMMMYSALNLRPYLSPSPSNASYWFLAVGYFNVVLPSFLPRSSTTSTLTNPSPAATATPASSSITSYPTPTTTPTPPSPALQKTFWHRARTAKQQSTAAAKSRMLVPRTRCMALERGARARRFAAHDDALPMHTPPLPPTPQPTPVPAPPHAHAQASKPPSAALVGLSLLGNLDGMYAHAAYPALALHTLTTGSRQRAGAMLLFGYTFKGRLWLSLGYDECGFERAQVGAWWAGVVGGVGEFMAV